MSDGSDLKVSRKMTDRRPAVGPYSQAVIAGPHIFVSGQLPADAAGNILQGSIAEQTTACCENVKHILEDAGSSITRVVKVSDDRDSRFSITSRSMTDVERRPVELKFSPVWRLSREH